MFQRKWLNEACEQIDAAVFTGDVLHDSDSTDREELNIGQEAICPDKEPT